MVVNLMFLMIPFFFTIYLFFNYGAESAIEKSVIPFMILFPLSFNVFLSPYVPLLTFYSCAIIPLFVIGLIIYLINWYKYGRAKPIEETGDKSPPP